ncbi:MAG: hypothetical protein J3Q66DRAFT_328567, partial [Benniella sp.]
MFFFFFYCSRLSLADCIYPIFRFSLPTYTSRVVSLHRLLEVYSVLYPVSVFFFFFLCNIVSLSAVHPSALLCVISLYHLLDFLFSLRRPTLPLSPPNTLAYYHLPRGWEVRGGNDQEKEKKKKKV